jgi:hypothetical protein
MTMNSVWENFAGTLRIETEHGWVVAGPTGGLELVPDETKVWRNSAPVWESLAGGGSRLRTPIGWIISGPNSGLAYVGDENHSWAAVGFDLPVVPPVPPPYVPSSVQTLTQPTITEFMAKGTDGVWRSQPGWTSKIACLQFHIGDGRYRDTFDVRFSRRAKYPFAGNVKVFRVWMPGFGYPNFYAGEPQAGWFFVYTEKLPIINSRQTFKYPAPNGQWRDEHWTWTAPSGRGKNDGKFRVDVGGVTLINTTDLQMDSAQFPGVPSLICIQDDPSNQVFPSDSFVEVKNITVTRKRGQ